MFQLVDDLVLVGIRTGQRLDSLEALNHKDLSAGTLSVLICYFCARL